MKKLPLCLCGCKKRVTKKNNKYLKGHNKKLWIKENKEKFLEMCSYAGKKAQEKHPRDSEYMKELTLSWKNKDPEGFKKHMKKMNEKGARLGGIAVQKKYGREHFSKKLKETHKKYPGLWKETMKKTHQRMKKEDPVKYKKEQTRKAIIACETIRKKSPYVWDNVNFLSKSEMECAKLILEKPRVGINCHIKIGSKIIDFFPQTYDKKYNNCFVEFHPGFCDKRTKEEYFNERKNIIKNSIYKDRKLILITDLKEITFQKS